MRVYHILNGDALKSQFPTATISGDLIVARECLVDGEVHGETLENFFATRARTLVDLYGPLDEDYFEKVVPEITRIVDISEGEVNLWFEDDLFCQVNLWFVCSLLKQKQISVNLIKPTSSLQYGFGGMDQEALFLAYQNKYSITSLDVHDLAKLWATYQAGDNDKLLKITEALQSKFPFLEEAVHAQLGRTNEKELGRPEKVLLEIIEEVGSDFKKVFPEFCKREPIYGFGDMQVKRLFDTLTSD